MRLVYVVRDPVERTVSSYRYNRHAILERREDFDALLASLDTDQALFTSRYALQLELYLEHFAPEQILVLDHADLQDRRAETIARVFRFAGVDDTFRSPEFEWLHNVTAGDRRPNRAGRAAVSLADRVLGPRRTATLRARAPHGALPFLVHRPDVPEIRLEPGERARLEDHLRADAARFRELTGLHFARWSI